MEGCHTLAGALNTITHADGLVVAIDLSQVNAMICVSVVLKLRHDGGHWHQRRPFAMGQVSELGRRKLLKTKSEDSCSATFK